MFFLFLLAMIPILWLVIALSVLKMPGHKACFLAWVLTALLSMFCWKFPAGNMATATLEGVLNALWPICLVIIAALFTYNLILKTGAMEEIKKMLASVSTDKRVLLLLIGWGFGKLYGRYGGLWNRGCDPGIYAGWYRCGSNRSSSRVSGCQFHAHRVWFCRSSDDDTGFRSGSGDHGIIHPCGNASGNSGHPFSIPSGGDRFQKHQSTERHASHDPDCGAVLPDSWYAAACFIGPELPDIIGSICSMVCIVLASRVLNREPAPEYSIEVSGETEGHSFSVGEGLKAWCPFVLIFILLMATSNLCPPIHNAIAGIKTSVQVYSGENAGKLSFSWINTPGVIIFVAAITAAWYRDPHLESWQRYLQKP